MITLDSASVITGTQVSSLTFAHTVAAGNDRILMVGSAFNNNLSDVVISGITYGGVALTFVGAVATGNDSRAEIWRLLAPAVGTADVVVTYVGTPQINTGFVAGAASFFGVDQTVPLGTVATAFGADALATVTIASAVDELVFDTAGSEDSGGLLTPGAGQSTLWNTVGGSGSRQEQCGASTKPGSISVTMDWTLVMAEDWVIVAVALLPAPVVASGGGSPSSSVLTLLGM